MTKWIRADHAQAEKEAAVAAAYEDAARLVETFGITRDEFEFHNGNPRPSLAEAIRARADTDALEAVKAEARAEALREAALLMNYRGQDAAEGEDWAACESYEEAENVILALIPVYQEGDG